MDEYIASFPIQTRKILEKIRKSIKAAAPGAKETIKYGIPTLTLNGNLVHFAGYKKHIGFYPTPSAIRKFREELGTYKVSKGAIQFPIEKALPLELITKMVKFRVKENKGRLL